MQHYILNNLYMDNDSNSYINNNDNNLYIDNNNDYSLYMDNKYNNYDIHYAIKYNKIYLLDFLCKNNYNINFKCEGKTPLYLACEMNNYNAIKILINYKADINIPCCRHDVLNYVCQNKYLKMLEILLTLPDINTNMKDQYNLMTGFEYCIYNDRNEMIKSFIKSEHILEINSIKCLDKVINDKNIELLSSLLLNIKININKTNYSSEHIIFKTSHVNWYDGCFLLLMFGCNPNIKNKDGMTFWDCIKLRRNMVLSELRIEGCCYNNNKNDNIIIPDNFYKNKKCKIFLDNLIFYDDIYNLLSKFKEGWNPNNNNLYFLSQYDIFNWLLLNKYLKKRNIIIPKFISYYIIKWINNINYYEFVDFKLPN